MTAAAYGAIRGRRVCYRGTARAAAVTCKPMLSTTDARLVAAEPPRLLVAGAYVPGGGRIATALVDGETAVVTSGASSPLKLLVPRSRGRCAWAFTSTFGGGLLAGDRIDLGVTVGDGTALLLGTQASTKIYRNRRNGDAGATRPATQSLGATVGDGATLLVLPDPVTPFAASSYEQRQRFELSSTATLIFLDWLTSGRLARGERWAMTRYLSRNEILVAGRRVATDALRLDSEFGDPIDAPHRMGRFDCYATLTLLGPRAMDGATAILAELATAPVQRRAPLMAAASPLGDGGAIVRVLGASPQDVGRYIRQRLAFAWPIAGEDPWGRKM
jgi:urease accessory protein